MSDRGSAPRRNPPHNPLPTHRRPASKRQRREIHELAATRGVMASLRLGHMTSEEAKAELARLRRLPPVYASEKQRRLLRTMAKERGALIDLPRRLPVERVETEMRRLRKLRKHA